LRAQQEILSRLALHRETVNGWHHPIPSTINLNGANRLGIPNPKITDQY
jgi:hypothetical protein